MMRLRVGIGLIILSWIPFAQIILAIAHSEHKLATEETSQVFRLSVWGLQILIGFIGLWLAGKVAMSQVKKEGWKKAPPRLWHLFMHGE